MQLYHGSHARIDAITATGLFDGVFAAAAVEAARSHGDVLHVVTSPRPLTDCALNHEVGGAWAAAVEVARGDEAIAEAIMSADCPTLDDCEPEGLAEQGWEFQRLRGRLAAKLGFTSVEMRDEHGTTWLCLPGCDIAVAEAADA